MINIKKYKFRVLVPSLYILFVVSALIFMIKTYNDNALCGVYAIVITCPWSIILTSIAVIISPDIFNCSMIPGIIIIVLSALINIIFLFFISYKLDRRKITNHK